MSTVGIVCDSTCDLGRDALDAIGVEMVPLKVLIGEETYLDWVDITPAPFYEKLADAPALPTTSQPSPADFQVVFERLAAAGAREIVAITLTSALSGTHQSACIAAETAPVPVRVVDTKVVSQAVGLVVKAAAAARDAGRDGAGVEQVVRDVVSSIRLFFVLDTLDYLVKGGRAGKAQGLAASVLNIKPILTFCDDGTIEPFKKAKGTSKAFAALAAHVAEASAGGMLKVAFLHAVAPDLVDQLRAALDQAGADYEVDGVGLVGPVIGTYAGPGAVGLAYHPAGLVPA